MRSNSRTVAAIMALLFAVPLMATLALLAHAQDEDQQPLPEITIAGYDITSPPTVMLFVAGRGADGAAIDLETEPFTLTHNGQGVVPSRSGSYPAGSFTVFLIDIPTGVAEQIPNIQDAISQFASAEGGMQEQVDAVAIYQVGESGAVQLLEPTKFYNAVDNLFFNELTPETGSTALIDSLAGLVEQANSLKPEPGMTTSVVVMTDGTDVVSTENAPGDVISKAISQTVPVHTIWVSSADLTFTGQEQGQAYLQDVASGTQGLATHLDDEEGLRALWAHIATFRDQPILQYEAPDLSGNFHDIELRLNNYPQVVAGLTIEVPENQPQITLNLPPGAEVLTVPDLSESVPVRLGATVSWLDGLEREITSARLSVNGVDVSDLPPEEIGDFTIGIDSFQFGSNVLELTVTDEQGLHATNPPVTLILEQGELAIPEGLQPAAEASGFLRTALPVALIIVLVLLVIYWLARRGSASGLLPRGRSRRNPAPVTYSVASEEAVPIDAPEGTDTAVRAYLEVLESITRMPDRIDLTAPVVRLGRSPDQAEVAFREDLTVSRLHASLMLEANHYRIFDENSTSGTWVNARQVPEYGIQLSDGDEIHVGAVHLLYRLA